MWRTLQKQTGSKTRKRALHSRCEISHDDKVRIPSQRWNFAHLNKVRNYFKVRNLSRCEFPNEFSHTTFKVRKFSHRAKSSWHTSAIFAHLKPNFAPCETRCEIFHSAKLSAKNAKQGANSSVQDGNFAHAIQGAKFQSKVRKFRTLLENPNNHLAPFRPWQRLEEAFPPPHPHRSSTTAIHHWGRHFATCSHSAIPHLRGTPSQRRYPTRRPPTNPVTPADQSKRPVSRPPTKRTKFSGPGEPSQPPRQSRLQRNLDSCPQTAARAQRFIPTAVEISGSGPHSLRGHGPYLVQGTSTASVLTRRELPSGMLLIDVLLRANIFPLQHKVQRRGAILEALFRISEGYYFGPHHLIMTSLLHFEEKVHQKKLQRADVIPLLFPRLLCQILEHLGYPEEPRLERRRHCREDFSLDKWHHLAAYFAPQGAQLASTSGAPAEPAPHGPPVMPPPPELPQDEQLPQAQQDEILTDTTPPAPAAHTSVHMPEAIHPTSPLTQGATSHASYPSTSSFI
ncbi:hypothetical protein CK203_066027 [Vitis vinifera]|uniref:Uncharacterized protein n=1 Tax=Vitis vinifera TaxID=29760 RepID=A0A438FP20_VITVI|nr:hypothetical protein CK203_066027 [Vitis vinifera]